MSRSLTKLMDSIDAGQLDSFIKTKVQDVKGLASILEILYEHLGNKEDKVGQLIIEKCLDQIESKNFFNKKEEPLEPQTISQRIPEENINQAQKPKEGKTKIKTAKKHINENLKVSKTIEENKEKQEDNKLIPNFNAWPGDDGFTELEVEVWNASDLKDVALKYQVENNFLKLTDISPDFKYIYMNSYTEEAAEQIYEAFHAEEYLGLDSEFHLREAKCTYIQLASPKFGVIFNIQNTKFRFDDRFKAGLKDLLESQRIKKIGHSISQDIRVIKRAFFGGLQIHQQLSLEDMLFTCRVAILGLSSLCLRIFGKSLNKEFQSWIGERTEMDEEEQMEYAIMDALAPVSIFNRMQDYCQTAVRKGTFMVNCDERTRIDTSEVLLDQQMDQTRVFFDRFNLRSTVLTDKTYQGIPGLCRT